MTDARRQRADREDAVRDAGAPSGQAAPQAADVAHREEAADVAGREGAAPQAADVAVREEAADVAGREGAASFQRPTTGLGVDIVEVERMRAVAERSPAFVRRVFTDAERAYCEAGRKPYVHFATHFAAKEAAAKALGTGFSGGVRPTDIEVVHDDRGRPRAVLHGRAAEIASETGVTELAISLSRTHETAIANAVALTEASRPPRVDAAPTAADELDARFKALRGVVDEVG